VLHYNTATHCNTLQHTATHCNTLQHTATHCNTLQQVVVTRACLMKAEWASGIEPLQVCCSVLQRVASFCSILQRVAARMGLGHRFFLICMSIYCNLQDDTLPYPLHRYEFGPPKFFSKTFKFAMIFYSTWQILGGGQWRKACRSRKKESKQSEIT